MRATRAAAVHPTPVREAATGRITRYRARAVKATSEHGFLKWEVRKSTAYVSMRMGERSDFPNEVEVRVGSPVASERTRKAA